MLDETERMKERKKKMDKIEILAFGFLDLVKKVSTLLKIGHRGKTPRLT